MSLKKAEPSVNDKSLTSLGVPLVKKEEGLWTIDLNDLKLFTGLSVIARVLGDEILDQCRAGKSDIVVQRRVISEITPELASLGLSSILIYARNNILEHLPQYQDDFHMQIRTVFGTLQRPSWAGALFPELFPEAAEDKTQNPPALLFPFHLHYQAEEIDYFFLVERDIQGQFLRITIEREQDSRLNLSKIPHRIVNDLSNRVYLQGLTRIAESIYFGIQRECENYRNEYSDHARRHEVFFNQLKSSGLRECDQITMRWHMDRTEFLLQNDASAVITFIKKILILLEDRDITSVLENGGTIEMISGGDAVYMDLSRKGRCLNATFDRPREVTGVSQYLDRMPVLKSISLSRRAHFKKTRIFLIHHITSEILATIKAIENMGCSFLHVHFVKYAGMVPSDYLEALLSLSEEKFLFSGLQKIESAGDIEGYYVLSRQYSPISHLEDLENRFEESKLNFFDAMQMAAGHLFFRNAILAAHRKETILLIEDGGYLAPKLNQMCLEEMSLSQALEFYGVRSKNEESEFGTAFAALSKKELDSPLANWLGKILPGTVEHTRNGYNRLSDVIKSRGKLQFPACTIAVSNIKRNMESQEVSISILHAVESILHGLGLVFSQRRALVLGSRGAIGRNLMEDISARLGEEKTAGVDIAPGKTTPWLQTKLISEIPGEYLYDTDVFLGVIGHSIMEKDLLEDLVLNSKRPYLFFASGSTKTQEFTHLSAWLQELQKSKSQKIGKKSVRLVSSPIRDPQSALIQGNRVRIEEAGSGELIRELFLLGGLTPINFLYYGVPTETMDPILAQLIQVASSMLESIRKGVKLPADLLAVDEKISSDADLLDG